MSTNNLLFFVDILHNTLENNKELGEESERTGTESVPIRGYILEMLKCFVKLRSAKSKTK